MNNKTQYVSHSKIAKDFSVSNSTLRKWADQQRIKCRRMPGGKRLYLYGDIERALTDTDQSNATSDAVAIDAQPAITRASICYARVSSQHQQSDLDRQIADLTTAYPGYELVSDIGSGLNWSRQGLKTILDRAIAGGVETVVVKHKDRLCRFGFELVSWIFEKSNTKLVVHGSNDASSNTGSSDKELVDDLLSIITVFVAKNNGRRSAQNRRARKRAAEEDCQGTSISEKDAGCVGGEGQGESNTEEAQVV